MGLRKPAPPNVDLERLLDERIDLNVQRSVMRETPRLDQAELGGLTSKLEAIEDKSQAMRENPNGWNRDTS